jgi:uncharacterized protein YpmS
MKAKYVVLGALAGAMVTMAALAVILAIVIMRPAPEAAEPPSDPSGDVVVSVGEDLISAVATDLARSEEPSIQRVLVDVRPAGRVDMTVAARVSILGVQTNVNVELITLAHVDDGRLRFSVQNIGVAGIGIPLDVLPGSLRSAIETMETDANQQANTLLAESGFVPASVTTDESSVTVALRAE